MAADRPDVRPLTSSTDTDLAGSEIPDGAVMHTVPRRRPIAIRRGGTTPTRFDPGARCKAISASAADAHICLGMHVARAEITTAIAGLLDRLPNLRLDPDAPAPKITGMYERGPTAVPVLWDAA